MSRPSSPRLTRLAALTTAVAATAAGIVVTGSPASAATKPAPRVAVSTYLIDVTPPCEAEKCTLVAYVADAFRLDVDRVSSRKPLVILRRLHDQKIMKSWNVEARPTASRGNAFRLDTEISDCHKETADAYFRVYDPATKRWSAPKYVSADCDVNYPL